MSCFTGSVKEFCFTALNLFKEKMAFVIYFSGPDAYCPYNYNHICPKTDLFTIYASVKYIGQDYFIRLCEECAGLESLEKYWETVEFPCLKNSSSVIHSAVISIVMSHIVKGSFPRS